MDINTGFFIYATLFRLTIVAVGAGSIVLGYRLFVRDPIGQGKTSAIAEAGGFKLTLRNFWPGAYFALFGTVIIGIMLWQGNPELILRELRVTKDKQGNEVVTVSRQTEVRGDEAENNILENWKKLSDPNLPLEQAAHAIHAIARIWKNEQRTGEALAFAKLAARIKPKEAEYLALLAELFQANGEPDKAIETLRAAAGLDAYYQEQLNKLQETQRQD
jgi:hypothetical protein